MAGKITYTYTPSNWDQQRFLSLGGFVVVFLNYNKAAFIEKSVPSALNQDFPLCEMFFMDDASSDGSGDTMERIVRKYHGLHKVTVVRNETNHRIVGQWNQVVKLATGIWFGMFCGDDIAMPNRVTLAAKRIAEMPTLKGLCASGVQVNSITGNSDEILGVAGVSYETGVCDVVAISNHSTPIIGATAFWHRSLFDNELPFAPLDDVLLRWILQAKNFGEGRPVWLWDGESKVIQYEVGTGVSTSNLGEDNYQPGTFKHELIWQKSRRRFYGLMELSWTGFKKYVVDNKLDECFLSIAQQMIFHYAILSGGLRHKLISFFHTPRACRKRDLKLYTKSILIGIFGLPVQVAFQRIRRGCFKI